MTEKIILKKCTTDDLETLCTISRKTYEQTFAPLTTPENMQIFLAKAFDLEKLLNELSDKNSSFYFLFQENELAGYLKVNETPSQSDINDSQSLELERIFVKAEFQGKGLGQLLLEHAIQIAREKKKTYLWLGVWEKNKKALAFYQKNGFYQIGTHPYILGEDVQIDYILRRDLYSEDTLNSR